MQIRTGIITLAQLLSTLGTLTASAIITLLGAPNNTTTFLRGDGTFATSGGATITSQSLYLSSDFTSSSNSYIDITGLSLTMPTRTGKFLMSATICFLRNAAGDTQLAIRVVNGVTNEQGTTQYPSTTTDNVSMSVSEQGSLSGQVVKLQFRSASANSITIRSGDIVATYMNDIEVSSP